jgi:16S rRNA (guanine966-N2)-methyltransferase
LDFVLAFGIQRDHHWTLPNLPQLSALHLHPSSIHFPFQNFTLLSLHFILATVSLYHVIFLLTLNSITSSLQQLSTVDDISGRYVATPNIMCYLLFLTLLLASHSQALQINPPGKSSFMKRRPFMSLVLHSSESMDSASGSSTDQFSEKLQKRLSAKRPLLGHVVPVDSPFRKGGSSNPRVRAQGKAREAGFNNPSMLKIAGGSAKGRRLDSPTVFLRPMMGKVREAVYSTFTAFGLYDSESTRHLDIFAGSGSVGIESLSRGAAHCTFVDLSDDCCATIQRNLKWCQFEKEGEVICGDAISVLKTPQNHGLSTLEPFHIVTLCPPYEEVVYSELILAVANSPLVMDDTVILIEYPVELGLLPHAIRRDDGGVLIGVRNRRYGRTVIAMYVVNPTGKLEIATSRPEEFVEAKKY